MRNAGLEEAQAGIKIAGRNINNLRYADVQLQHNIRPSILGAFSNFLDQEGKQVSSPFHHLNTSQCMYSM